MLRQACGHGRPYAGQTANHASLVPMFPIRRHLATLSTNTGQSLAPGKQLHGFTLRRQKHVPELQLTAYELQHDRTGADYLHIDRSDKNNVFSIGFKTNPPDDTGVPHILEHTTLCGSVKYETSQLEIYRKIDHLAGIQFGIRSSKCCRDLYQIL